MADNGGKTSRFDLIFGGSDQTGGERFRVCRAVFLV